MTEHESDPRYDPARGTGQGSAPEPPRPAGAEQPTERLARPSGAEPAAAPSSGEQFARPAAGGDQFAPPPAGGEPFTRPAGGEPFARPAGGEPFVRPAGGEQPTLPNHPQPVSGTPVTGQPGDQPRSPWQPPYPQAGSGYPHYGYPSTGQPHGAPGQPQHGAPVPWAGPGGPGGPPPAQPWQHAGDPRRPNRVGRWIAAAAVALVLLLGAGLVGGVIGAALNGNDADNARARAAAAPVINRSSLAEIAQKVEPSIVSIDTGSGEGSGVVLTADGFVLTNNHVVASASGDTVRVVFDNGRRANATIVGTDPKSDLAVVKASGVSGLSPATFGDSASVQVGDTVLALGSPLGLQGSVTAGIISAKDRTIRTQSEQQPPNPFGGGANQQPTATSLSGLLQTDAPINPGNSGGALVNTNGEVIGINTAIATSGQGSGSIGVGFAIPSAKAEQVANMLRTGQKVSHAALGVEVADEDNGGGAIIRNVTPNGAAAKAGLQQGDIVRTFDGQEINSSDELVAAVQSHKAGDQVQLTYTRNGAENTATVTLTEAS